MAFIVPTKSRRFEIREARSTPRGPRSRTLASFTELTPEAIAKAQERAAKPLDADELRASARRVGAPVAREPVDRAARELISELGKGHALDPTLRQMLLSLLEKRRLGSIRQPGGHEATNEVAEWMAATPAARGKALVDLLLLADALPSGGRRGKPLQFPKLESTDR